MHAYVILWFRDHILYLLKTIFVTKRTLFWFSIFICSNCADYDLCEWCEPGSDAVHPKDHVFLKIKIPGPRIGVGRDGKPAPLLKRNLYTHQRSTDTVTRPTGCV